MLLIFWFAIQSAARAELPAPRCARELARVEHEAGSAGRWVEAGPEPGMERIFRAPTRDFGRWLEAAWGGGALRLREISSGRIREIRFGDGCRAVEREQPGLSFQVGAAGRWLDDDRLQKLLERKRSGLIYVWSPEMIYSARYRSHFEAVARRMSLAFVPVLDPLAAPRGRDPKLGSVELYLRGLTNHFPTSLLFRDGKILEGPIVGVLSEESLERELTRRLTEHR